MCCTAHRTRTIATLLALTICWNGFAHAAKPSRRVALLQAAASGSLAFAMPEAQTPGASPEQQQEATPGAGLPTAPSPAFKQTQGQSAGERVRFAHTVFLAQTGNDPHFALSETDTYNTVLNALNQWGRFQLVADARKADLVLQLHGVAIASFVGDTPSDPTSSIVYRSVLRLTVADPHTLSPIWLVNTPVQPAIRAKSQAKNVALTGENIVSQLKLLAGDTLSRQEQAQLKQANDKHLGRYFLFAAGGVALTLGIFFIAKHAAQQNQASFCQQHNISPCPGA